MSLLTVIQKACTRIGITSPAAVIGNQNNQIIQLLAIANEECEEIVTGSSIGMAIDWQELQNEASFVTVAAEDQGNIYTIAPGYRYIINGTIWDRSTKLPAYGGLSPQQWQAFKAWGVTNPYPQFRIRQDRLLLTPTPAVGQNYFFEYQSANWCLSVDTTTHNAWTLDSDICKIDEQLIVAGIIWRWKQIKGLDYAEDFRKYVTRVTGAIARNSAAPNLDLGTNNTYSAGIVVPIGSWGA